MKASVHDIHITGRLVGHLNCELVGLGRCVLILECAPSCRDSEATG